MNGLVEFVAYIFIAITMDRLGRKSLLCGCLILGGLGCLSSTVFNHYAADNQGATSSKLKIFCLN